MLTFYLTKEQIPAGKHLLRDVEKLFAQTPIPFTEYSKTAVAEIDNGTLLSPHSYRSRFGTEVSVTFLSTGCKAALLASVVTDGVLDMSEAGSNVLPVLFANLKDGEFLYTPGSVGMLTFSVEPAGVVKWGNCVCETAQDILDAQKCQGEVV